MNKHERMLVGAWAKYCRSEEGKRRPKRCEDTECGQTYCPRGGGGSGSVQENVTGRNI